MAGHPAGRDVSICVHARLISGTTLQGTSGMLVTQDACTDDCPVCRRVAEAPGVAAIVTVHVF